jgi:hypothetical protein
VHDRARASVVCACVSAAHVCVGRCAQWPFSLQTGREAPIPQLEPWGNSIPSVTLCLSVVLSFQPFICTSARRQAGRQTDSPHLRPQAGQAVSRGRRQGHQHLGLLALRLRLTGQPGRRRQQDRAAAARNRRRWIVWTGRCGLSVCPSVRLSVCLSVHLSVSASGLGGAWKGRRSLAVRTDR